MAVSRSSLNSLALAMLVVAGILIISGENAIAVNCDNDIIGLASKCREFVAKEGPKEKPSKECCSVVKKADVPCLCSHVTKQIENLISMEKVFYVAESCGKKVASGTKCGSYTVPSA